MSAYSPQRDPRTGYGAMIAVAWVETALACSAVAVRTWIRLTFEVDSFRKTVVDDVFIWFALMLLIIQNILYTFIAKDIWMLMALLEGKRGPWPTFVDDTTFYLKCQFVIVLLFWTVLWSAKAAFLALYHRLFDRYRGWQRLGWWVVVCITVTGYVINWILQFLACQPLSSYFTIGMCNTPTDVSISNINLYVSTAFDIGSDLLIMILPISLLIGLKLDKRNKTALGAVFASGFVIIVFAAMRLALNVPHGQVHVNPKWLAYMSTAETSISVIVACTPTFRRLFTERPRGSKNRSGVHQSHRLEDDSVFTATKSTASDKDLRKCQSNRSIGKSEVDIEMAEVHSRPSNADSGVSNARLTAAPPLPADDEVEQSGRKGWRMQVCKHSSH